MAVRASAAGTLPLEGSIYRVAALAPFPELVQGISTRLSPDGEDWNLSILRGTPAHPPSVDRALDNRHKLAERLGISLDRMVGCHQVHGSEVAPVGLAEAGSGMSPDRPPIQGADGMVTNTPGLYLLALSADCPPVFFYDPVKRAVGLVHSGWKGTVARIAARAVEAMQREFGSVPADIVSVVGPGIGACCYQVGQNVVEAAEAAFPGAWDEGILQTRDGGNYFSLPGAIRRTLSEAGLDPEHIAVEDVCTGHSTHTFYSHRAEAGQCGLFGAVLGLREA